MSNRLTKKQQVRLIRILISSVLLICAAIAKNFFAEEFENNKIIPLIVFLIPYILIGYDILLRAIRNIFNGQVFDENFLMTLATIGAFFIGEYPEAVFVMIFYQTGELFEDYAVGKSRKSISKMMDIRPDYANIEIDGKLTEVSPDSIEIGSTIFVKPGEKIPIDGIVLKGVSNLDTKALTGESLPREVNIGDNVISGCVNLNGLLEIQTTKLFSQSSVSKILDLVENAVNKKAKSENFITRFARYYTPIVVISAVLLAVIPPLILNGMWADWLKRALIFLVVSCPCALVISIPLSFFGGIGGASSKGILIKGGNYLEALAKSEIAVFDKTGTLTKGVFVVSAIHPEKVDEDDLLMYAALAEIYSNHPISESLRTAYFEKQGSTYKSMDDFISSKKDRVKDIKEIEGHGIEANIDGKIVCVGNSKLMKKYNALYHDCHLTGTVIHVAIDGLYVGHIVISDQIKEQSKDAIKSLKEVGIKKTVMLTGDLKAVGENVAKEIGIDEVHTELLPSDKVEVVEKLIENKTGCLLFVGDGINDAPVLSRADVGIAMGALGSDAAIEAADIVLMDDNPLKISSAIKIARRTLVIVKQNITFALGIKILVLILGALGIANMWEATFADVGVSVIAILNAMRTLKVKD